jgi:uncharacterized membrane-anchored protein YjiN (DUF445 family)
MLSRPELKDLQLRRMKRWAGILLFSMACLYVLASALEGGHPSLFWLTAFTEAAMVGAIADWFAVVALFHHPLGLRLPHTAVIPRNKGRIAEGVADFIESNFLSPEAIVARIAEARPARTLCAWLLGPGNAGTLAEYAGRLLAYGLTVFDDARIKRFFMELISRKAKDLDVAAAVAEILEVLTQNGRHHELLDQALAGLDELLSRPETRRMVAAEVAKNLPFLLKTVSEALRLELDERAALKILDIAAAKIAEVRQDRGHELRQRFDAYAAGFVRRLKDDEGTRARVHALRDEVLANPALGRYVEGLWEDFRAWLAADLHQSESTVRRRLTEVVETFATKLDQDAEVQRWLDEQILAALPSLVREHRAKIGRFVEDQVNGWQESRLVQELERELGPDLQYIRINGTLVGGMAGLLIAGLTHFVRFSV